MLLFLETVDIAAIFLMLFILVVILKQPASKVQTAFILYNVFSMVFVVGIHLELIHSDTIGEALAGLCVQYIGQAGLLLSLLWFVSEFARFCIPVWVYWLEAICDAFVIAGIFTAEKHKLFYTSMKILTDGIYNRIEVGHGVLWYLHFIILDAIVSTLLILGIIRYKKSTPVQRKRILYIEAGMGTLEITLLLKRAGLFGSYNPIVIAMAFSMFCMMVAMVKYRYFGSLNAAVDNAFNHGNEGLVILDSDGLVIFANYKMEELFPGINKKDTDTNYKEIKEFIENGEKFLHKNGISYELRIEDIIENGEKNGRMLWFVDQTQTLLTMQKLKEADEAKTQFLMRTSHELRTPLNTMLGMNEMIMRESKEEKTRDYAEKIAFAGNHMMLLVDEVLNASRIESGTLGIVKVPYNVKEVLGKAEEFMRYQAEKKGLIFTVKIKDGIKEDTFQAGDSAHIFLVLINLLSNAVKYTDTGFINLGAEIKTEECGKRLIFFVSDSGIGICKEDIKQIFENFGRGSNIEGRDGMGLGLSIVKRLVEAMGGIITVESTPGKGSCFIISFAWEEPSHKEIEAYKRKEQENKETKPGRNKKECPDFSGKIILAADDNKNNLMVLEHLLKRTNAIVETVAGGKAAIEACINKKYDIILLDHMMPDIDGIAALHQIKKAQNGKNNNTCIIALTANAGNGAEQMYLSEGFDGYLPKPVNPEKLEQMLFSFLNPDKENGISIAKNTCQENSMEENIQEDIQEKDGWYWKLKESGINIQEGLCYADMDIIFYQELLILFAKHSIEYKHKLDNIYNTIIKPQGREAGNNMEYKTSENNSEWTEWTALCHRIKGEAKGIGAVTLGSYFTQLEAAGNARDKEKAIEIYPAACKELQKTADNIINASKKPPL